MELCCRLGARSLNTTHVWSRSTAPQPDGIGCEWILLREENRSTRRKTLGVRLRSTETQPTYDLGAQSWTRVAEVEGTVDNHWAILTPLTFSFNFFVQLFRSTFSFNFFNNFRIMSKLVMMPSLFCRFWGFPYSSGMASTAVDQLPRFKHWRLEKYLTRKLRRPVVVKIVDPNGIRPKLRSYYGNKWTPWDPLKMVVVVAGTVTLGLVIWWSRHESHLGLSWWP